MKPSGLRKLRRILPLAIAAVALVILNGVSWWTYQTGSDEVRESFRRSLLLTTQLLARQVENAYQRDLDRRLSNLERASPSVSAGSGTPELNLIQSLENLVPPLDDWLKEKGRALLSELTAKNWFEEDYHDVYFLDGKGGLIITLSGAFVPNAEASVPGTEWNIHPLLVEDSAEIKRVLREGSPRTSQEVLDRGIYYLTAYAPMLLGDSSAGALGMRANLLFGERLSVMWHRILAADLVGSALVVLLAAMFYRVWLGLEAAEDRLRQQERLAQLGQMVSVVAHEIRNPLGIIEQTAELVRRRYVKEGKDELLDYIPDEVERLNRIVTRFLEFARSDLPADGATEASECDLVQEIHQVRELVLPQVEAAGLTLETDTDERAPGSVPRLSRDAARQILLNLLFNAMDACRPGGRIRIRLTDERGRPHLAVSDNGCGMTPDQLEKAMNPFFTTKEKGCGLGLAIVSKCVQECGGQVSIDTKEGHGTCVIITF